MKSPEILDKNYHRVSTFMRNLWLYHTTDKERYFLWFNKMSPNQQCQLWNSLSFSEDYIIHVLNTPKYFRHDLEFKLNEVLMRIKNLYVDKLTKEIESDKIDKKQMKNLKKKL